MSDLDTQICEQRPTARFTAIMLLAIFASCYVSNCWELGMAFGQDNPALSATTVLVPSEDIEAQSQGSQTPDTSGIDLQSSALAEPSVFLDDGSPDGNSSGKRAHWFELPTSLLDSKDSAYANNKTLAGRLLSDQMNFYSAESLTLLGGGLIVGGAMANSSVDSEIHRRFQSSVRSANSDDWFESLHSSKELGNGKYTLPVMAGAWAIGKIFPDSHFAGTAGTWGERSLRGILVGAPPLLALQQLTGGSRPTEISEGSEWHPFTDNNGISGHAFMGSLPFITAAKMSDSKGLKAIYYAASTVVPLSRVNDNAHYPSQVALGWWLAFLAASAVDATDNPNSRWKFHPYSTGAGSGVLAEYKY